MSTFVPYPELTDSKETVEFIAEFYKISIEKAEHLCRFTSKEQRVKNLAAQKAALDLIPAKEAEAFEKLKAEYKKRSYEAKKPPFHITPSSSRERAIEAYEYSQKLEAWREEVRKHWQTLKKKF